MAFEHESLPIVGLQFHPESVLTEHGYDLLAAFLRRRRSGAENAFRCERGRGSSRFGDRRCLAQGPHHILIIAGSYLVMTNQLLILEGIVTTVNADQTVNISPMGPMVDRQLSRMRLRPFKTSRTYTNLKRHGVGVFHVTDDVELIARCAIGHRASAAHATALRRLPVRCWPKRVVGTLSRSNAWTLEDRTTIECRIIDRGRIRDFFGFNRAKHAVIEAAILATRVDLLPPEQLERQLKDLAVWVAKTGGDQEHRAFALVQEYIRQHIQDR